MENLTKAQPFPVKSALQAGADSLTPSVPQYFSWINSTNEGSTEEQTLINLAYFRYMRETYGMQIALYAWDAGNFDGASDGYGNVDGKKFRSQYPTGYKNVVDAAASIGIRMGLWGSPDGYGDDPETERKRYEFFVHLCRDYHFMEFKFDRVCGNLRPEKAQLFADMLKECRKYSPDLIVLNHRLPLYEAEPYATTYLWQGAESYTDATCTKPKNTAMHNRSYMFIRGLTPGMERLCEDHGVCISSSIDYFEDEMIYQAFSRCLILAPETYGNPWLLKDSEQPRYARIYNIHRRNAGILVQGMALGDELGAYPVSRGDGKKRYLCTGNNSWTPKKITVTVDGSIGITEPGEYQINLRHPYDEQLCVVPYGGTFTYTVNPFRSALIEIARQDVAEPILPGIAYAVIRESEDGTPLDIHVLRDGAGTFDLREKAPVCIGSLGDALAPDKDDEFLYESAMFAVSNDSLEAQSLLRAGDTAVPAIQAARDAFFRQQTYRLRGCENKCLFDGLEDTFFDAQSRSYKGGRRIDNGCLRVDFGDIYDADAVEIVSFAPDTPTDEAPAMPAPQQATYSADLRRWRQSDPATVGDGIPHIQPVVRFKVHTVYGVQGKKVTTVYAVKGGIRYFRLPEPMDRIYSVTLKKGGKALSLTHPFANNMMAPYAKRPSRFVKTVSVTLPTYEDGAYLALAVEGTHGAEGCYAVCTVEGKTYGFNRRSSAYPANVWENSIISIDAYYTYFLDLPKGLAGKEATVTLLVNGTDDYSLPGNLYLCDRHI